ncbi:hypothetical protein GCM10022254_37390 [Actinomadura meridiana]|uniref:Uncharacterized protein n=1 Tax=Actinomadura meridiana TaxID=559626 RepID=A0ABP8C540_9ACTN
MSYMINGLRVPKELVSTIESGRWTPPREEEPTYLAVFGEPAVHPMFYDLDTMARENSHWPGLSEDEVFGKERPGESLGVDSRKSLLVADLGPDMPIALDYRLSENPRVIYLRNQSPTAWVYIAPDIGSLISQLEL